MKILNKLSKKNLLLNKKRSIGTLIGIILSVALVCATVGLFISFRTALIESAIASRGNYHIALYNESEEKLKILKNNRDVARIDILYDIGYSKFADATEDRPYIHLYSYQDTKSFSNLAIKLVDGAYPKDKNELLISEELYLMNKDKYAIGNTITLNVGQRKTLDNYIMTKENPKTEEEVIADSFEMTFVITGIMERDYELDPYGDPGISVLTVDLDNQKITSQDSIFYIRIQKPTDYEKTFSEILGKTFNSNSENELAIAIAKDYVNKNITSDNRIVAAIPTIKYLMEHGAKVILCSHLGRPKGKVNPDFSLAPVAKRLSELLNKDVKLAEDIVGESAKKLTSEMQAGDVVLLENVRFDEREEKNDSEFSKELASLTDGIYVNDAFGTAHRAHCSTEGISHFVDIAVAGYLMEKEVSELSSAISNPERPFVSILGGLKVSDKIGVIENLLTKVDKILIGGAMACTFFKAMGYEIGDSKCEDDKLDEANRILKLAEEKNVKLVLPVDSHIANDFSNDAEDKFIDIKDGVPAGWEILDIGPKTQELFEEELKDAKTIVWNGPLGVNEFDNYRIGTEKIAKAIASSNAKCIIGGGDSAAAVKKIQKEANTTFDNIYISTGGGASLEFLEGKVLPGIACLDDKE